MQFLCKGYFATKTKDDTTTYRYRSVINRIHPEYPETLPSVAITKEELTQYIDVTITKCKHLTHAKHQKELRAKITDITKKHEENRQKGKIKKVVQWILEKETPRQLTKRIITRQNFTIRIATLNCNGAPKTASNQENMLTCPC